MFCSGGVGRRKPALKETKFWARHTPNQHQHQRTSDKGRLLCCLISLASWPKTFTWTHRKDYGWRPTSVMAWKWKTQCKHNDRQIEEQTKSLNNASCCPKIKIQAAKRADDNTEYRRGKIQKNKEKHITWKKYKPRWNSRLSGRTAKHTRPGNMRSKYRNTSNNNLTAWGKWEHSRETGSGKDRKWKVKHDTWGYNLQNGTGNK